MRCAFAVSALALASAALAQHTTIHVGSDANGNPGLFFSPSFINVVTGSVVTFVFDRPGTNHTVAQSSFAKPCEPLAGGFDSGYTPGPANADDLVSTWNLTITDDTKPIWFFCAQPAKTHCVAGMVGALNPPSPPAQNDFYAFLALATGASTIVQPTPALSGVGAFASLAPTADSVEPTTATAQSSGSSGGTTTTADATSSSASTPSSSATTLTVSDSGAGGATSSSSATTDSGESSAASTTSSGSAVSTGSTTTSATSSATALGSNTNAAAGWGTSWNSVVWAITAMAFGAAVL